MHICEQTQLVKKSLKTFLLLFLFLGALLGGMILVFYRLQTNNYVDRLCIEERHSLALHRVVVQNHFTSIIGDLMFLAEQEDLKAYMLDPSEHNLDSLKNEYLTLSTNKRIYDQIRYLDKKGQEIARVNYNGGTPTIVDKQSLQNKQLRYYFSDAFKLKQGEVFISPLDLNVELGEVESPFKPMIRFGTPVYDESGKKKGVVLLNYLGDNLLNLIQDVGVVAHGETMLLNAEGYWLKHPDAAKEWGFMFADKAHFSFAKQHPDIWQQFLVAPSGQVRTPLSVYTFETISPIDSDSLKGLMLNVDSIDTNIDSWKIVSFISPDTLSSYSRGLMANLFAFGAGLFLLLATGTWFLAMAITRRKLYQAQLFNMAHFDNLTGLPNRTLFFDRLNQTLQIAKRNDGQCALLYIDLDGFKNINDSLGHDAGDELLTAVAKRMDSYCRDSDTVSRLGGDEFAILLPEVSSLDGAQIFTEKILSSLETPFSLKKGEVKIGASIGVGMYPTHGITLEELLKNADQAMYQSKSRGKNTFTFAEKLD